MATAKVSQKWQINIPDEIIEVVTTAKKSKISNLRGAVHTDGEQNFPEIIAQARLEMVILRSKKKP